jgi:superfamily I DNA/RNA helicase/mRNA-degrading endonuclease RelE of RelBE toxin-antitoxin system
MTEWLVTQKPSFLNDLLTLSPKEIKQIQSKIAMLTKDPTPDAKVKKQLKYMDGRLYRMRSGDFRVFYTFKKPYISLLSLKRRDDDTYDEEFDIEYLGGLDLAAEQKSETPDWAQYLKTELPDPRRLPEPINDKLLNALKVDKLYHARLKELESEEELLSCPGIDDDVLLKLHEAIFEKPLREVLAQPDYLLNDTDDLLKFKEGDLAGFLLKLSPDQQALINWNISSDGPTLVKGGPGSGKSTIALYRVRAMIEACKSRGIDEPRILFTTYTNALKSFSESLLCSLLKTDIAFVEVRTADSFVKNILDEAGVSMKFSDEGALLKEIERSKQATAQGNNALERRKAQRLIQEVSNSYILEEILGLIIAHGVDDLTDYIEYPRCGRGQALNRTQREIIWKIKEHLVDSLESKGTTTWESLRAKAAELISKTSFFGAFDGVVVDEVQDLDPSVIEILRASCKSLNGLFLTADANQSIYGSNFLWSKMRRNLEKSENVRELSANFRSTREIAEAAANYLGDGSLDMDMSSQHYVHDGPMPVCWMTRDDDEVKILAKFIRSASRECHVGIGAAAILCPSSNIGHRLAKGLEKLGLEARFMTSAELDLNATGVKVITLKAAKGLEFPIIAICGLSPPYPYYAANATGGERQELLLKERRALYVGMTRAMRALLLIKPAVSNSSLVEGFDPHLWHQN